MTIVSFIQKFPIRTKFQKDCSILKLWKFFWLIFMIGISVLAFKNVKTRFLSFVMINVGSNNYQLSSFKWCRARWEINNHSSIIKTERIPLRHHRSTWMIWWILIRARLDLDHALGMGLDDNRELVIFIRFYRAIFLPIQYCNLSCTFISG